RTDDSLDSGDSRPGRPVSEMNGEEPSMKRMIVWPTAGFAGGFFAFLILFFLAVRRNPVPEPMILGVFSLMGAVPIGIFGAILAAFATIRDELGLLRREIERLQRLENLLVKATDTQFKAAPGQRGPNDSHDPVGGVGRSDRLRR